MRTAVLVGVVLAAGSAYADKVVVVGRVDGGPWTDAPTTARIDQRVELSFVVVGKHARGPDGVETAKVGGRKLRVQRLDAKAVQWSTVEPHGFRKQTAKNGATSDFYSNVSTESATFGRWLGYDHVDYFEHALPDKTPVLRATITPSEPDAVQVSGLGTLRFKVDVELADGEHLASPGADATDTFGILPTVHRVSIRAGDDFLGWLSSYLLVPEVFGSAGPGKNHQTDRFVGADCADVMIGAMRASGKRVAYTNVAGLPTYAKTIAKPLEVDARGMPSTPVSGVKTGDLIRIDYGGELRNHTPRNWDHVAALWEDKSDPTGPLRGAADGKLDGFDLVIHVGHPRLKIEPLANQSPATIDVLRWKK